MMNEGWFAFAVVYTNIVLYFFAINSIAEEIDWCNDTFQPIDEFLEKKKTILPSSGALHKQKTLRKEIQNYEQYFYKSYLKTKR